MSTTHVAVFPAVSVAVHVEVCCVPTARFAVSAGLQLVLTSGSLSLAVVAVATDIGTFSSTVKGRHSMRGSVTSARQASRQGQQRWHQCNTRLCSAYCTLLVSALRRATVRTCPAVLHRHAAQEARLGVSPCKERMHVSVSRTRACTSGTVWQVKQRIAGNAVTVAQAP